LDGIGRTEADSRKNFQKIHRMRNLLYSRVCALRRKRSFTKNISIFFSSCIPKFIIDERKLLEHIDTECGLRGFDEYEYVGNLLGNWKYREIVKNLVYGIPTEYNFENCTFYGVKDYDLYLRTMYGDYMELPSLEKRRSHHDYLHIDLNKSYLIRDENNNFF
jgi:lipopolysaccharide cholinephosphotransferase